MKRPDEPGRWQRLLVMFGGGALLLAMATELLAVIGRHTAMPLIGSIELVQAAVLVAAALAIVVATLTGRHALVRLVLDRIGPPGRAWLQFVNLSAAAAFFGALAIGSLWIAADLWRGHEESELLHIAFLPLRLLCSGAAIVAALLFLRQALRERRR